MNHILEFIIVVCVSNYEYMISPEVPSWYTPIYVAFASPSQLESHDEQRPAFGTVETIPAEETEEIIASVVDVPEAQRAALEVTSGINADVISDPGVVQDVNDAHTENRARIVSRLEGWLENIRRDVA